MIQGYMGAVRRKKLSHFEDMIIRVKALSKNIEYVEPKYIQNVDNNEACLARWW